MWRLRISSNSLNCCDRHSCRGQIREIFQFMLFTHKLHIPVLIIAFPSSVPIHVFSTPALMSQYPWHDSFHLFKALDEMWKKNLKIASLSDAPYSYRLWNVLVLFLYLLQLDVECCVGCCMSFFVDFML